ncbi:hypothetical protein SAMN02799630_03981 [Paenibacillus sp. UNCCL117]|uniref:hypothetical protein n=1 Tax=unclassified Paenibacillus TaxID=185978 RepID=UPI00088109FD|nr:MULTISPECIES: hypothetical protein [unclassified Paenibacillus]SDD76744.1 hypothetical protein SAMN04488602_11346 [Paenibacillus sp. cl123]SFW52536.1 hypothetical protein SAMN02799630_03981 [Paenibacillus sp. UNCCL117]
MEEKEYTVQATQSSMMAVMVPFITFPAIWIPLLSRNLDGWLQVLFIVLMLLMVVTGAAMMGMLLKPRPLQADGRRIRFGKREYAWSDIEKLAVHSKRRQVHLHMRGKWGSHYFDIRGEQAFAEAEEALSRLAAEQGVTVERK